MAVVRGMNPSFKLSSTENGTNTYVIGGMPSERDTGGLLVQVSDLGSLSYSMTVKGQNIQITKDRGAGTTPADDFEAIPYRKLNLNGTVADGSIVTAAITQKCIIWIPAMGMEVALDVTFTSGTGAVYVYPCLGAFAL